MTLATDITELKTLLKEGFDISVDKVESVPVDSFGILGMLEGCVKYLHENLGYSFVEISGMLKRDRRVISKSYYNANKKRNDRITTPGSVFVPVQVFNSGIGVLESIVSYLRDEKQMRYRDIAKILNRDERTIWTSYKKGKEKNN